MADGGFAVDGPYLRTAAQELVDALTAARVIVGGSASMPDLMRSAGSPQLAGQIMNIVDTSRDTMAALVAKGEAVAVGLLVAADKYDLAEARAWEAMQYPAPLVPPSQQTGPAPFDMTQPIGPAAPAAPGAPAGPGAAG